MPISFSSIAGSTFDGLAEYTINFSFQWLSIGESATYTAIEIADFPLAEGSYAISLVNVDSATTGAMRVYDAESNLLATLSPVGTTVGIYDIPANVASIEVDLTLVSQPSISATLLIQERNLTVANKYVPWTSELKIYTSSGNVTIPEGTYNFLISGGGGGGSGGSFGTGGWAGGGSGYITIGTVSGGTYPLVIGAGGNGSNLNSSTYSASNGGATTFNGLQANGGASGNAGSTGGSGGGGANNSNNSIAGTNGGYNGSNGGTGAAGSGYAVPSPWTAFTGAGGALAFSPGNTQYLGTEIRQAATGGGFYSGGGGQKGTNSYSLGVAYNTDGGNGIYGGGGGASGGGASNNYTGPGEGRGGTGGSGFLAVITTAI